VAVFPGDKVRGWLWPAVWFTAWHLIPLTAAGAGRRRAAVLLTGAALIGVGYGWVAVTTGSWPRCWARMPSPTRRECGQRKNSGWGTANRDDPGAPERTVRMVFRSG